MVILCDCKISAAEDAADERGMSALSVGGKG